MHEPSDSLQPETIDKLPDFLSDSPASLDTLHKASSQQALDIYAGSSHNNTFFDCFDGFNYNQQHQQTMRSRPSVTEAFESQPIENDFTTNASQSQLIPDEQKQIAAWQNCPNDAFEADNVAKQSLDVRKDSSQLFQVSN